MSTLSYYAYRKEQRVAKFILFLTFSPIFLLATAWPRALSLFFSQFTETPLLSVENDDGQKRDGGGETSIPPVLRPLFSQPPPFGRQLSGGGGTAGQQQQQQPARHPSPHRHPSGPLGPPLLPPPGHPGIHNISYDCFYEYGPYGYNSNMYFTSPRYLGDLYRSFGL